MLAATCKDISTIKYPVLVSPKLDGVRCIIKNGVALSRSLKPIPNRFVQKNIGNPIFNNLDGELIIGLPHSDTTYTTTVSGVMSRQLLTNFTYYVFDYIALHVCYIDRIRYLSQFKENRSGIVRWTQFMAHTEDDLLEFEDSYLQLGYEGVIIRDPRGMYKNGRSTLKEGGMLKLKRFVDSDAIITGFEPLYHNNNKSKTNELGQTDRSSHKANLTTDDSMLGALQVTDYHTGIEFNIGTGFTDDMRKDIWYNRERLFGSIVKYKYFPVGVKDKPRHPVFLGFRDQREM